MYKHVIQFLFFIMSIFIPIFACAEDAVIASSFSKYGAKGTIVISSLNSTQTYIHNDARAMQRFSPASTFKIINTLIAIEEKTTSGPDDVFKWDGHIYDFPSWNQDQTLTSAFKVSCVWCYQKLAQRIGDESYRAYLKQSSYGDLQSNFDTTTFWLDDSLQITAHGQVRFLKNLVQRSLPFKNGAYDTLRQIMHVETTPTYSLWAKTGWATMVMPRVGWYVGYVETLKDTWIFALNMDVNDKKDLPLRQKLVLEALHSKGIIE